MKAFVKKTRRLVSVIPVFGFHGVDFYQDTDNEDWFYDPCELEIFEYYGG